MSQLKPQFFPKDLPYLSYVDVWLPEDAPLSATRAVTDRVEGLIQQHAHEYFEHHGGHAGPRAGWSRSPRSSAAAARGSGSRSAPSCSRPTTRLIVIEGRTSTTRRDSSQALQDADLARGARRPGGRAPARDGPAGRRAGRHPAQRGRHADAAAPSRRSSWAILRRNPHAERVREDWGAESFTVDVAIDPDRANLAGLTNADVARRTAVGLNGLEVTSMLREGDADRPVVARLRMDERAQLGDLHNMYVYSSQGGQKVPPAADRLALDRDATGEDQAPEPVPHHHGAAFPRGGVAAVRGADVLARRTSTRFAASLPPGYRLQIAGEHEEQQRASAR